MRIEVDPAKCNVCQLCVKKCPYKAIQIQNKCAHILPACILCGVCVEVCPQHALTLIGAKQQSLDLTGDIWVYLETEKNAVSVPSQEIVSKLHLMLQHYSQPKKVLGLVMTDNPTTLENYETLCQIGLHGLLAMPSLSDLPVENKAEYLAGMIRKEKPFALLFPASDEGRDLAPRLATLLETGLTADCTELSFDPRTHLLVQTRPAFSGDLMASIVCPFHRPMMATIRPHSFPVVPIQDSPASLPVQMMAFKDPISEMTLPTIIAQEPKKSLYPPIEDKSIVIGVGRGIGSQENIRVVYEFAQSIHAGIACSRPIVDQGWLPSELQVGMSGKSIAPKIYVALGISGSVQHLTGIKGAELIIAVNKDEEAPIFQVAHISLVGDIKTLLPELKRYLSQEAK